MIDIAQKGEGSMSWFSAAQEQAFGKVLAEFYIARVPFESPFSAKKFAVKTQDTLKKMETQIARFNAEHKLNVYKKAKLGNSFKWTLRDAGYDGDYVNELTEWLMVHL